MRPLMWHEVATMAPNYQHALRDASQQRCPGRRTVVTRNVLTFPCLCPRRVLDRGLQGAFRQRAMWPATFYDTIPPICHSSGATQKERTITLPSLFEYHQTLKRFHDTGHPNRHPSVEEALLSHLAGCSLPPAPISDA